MPTMPCHRSSRQPTSNPAPEPFRSAEQAWLWTMAALVARREGSPRGVDGSGPPRVAVPEDVLRCLDGLYRNRRVVLLHARILRVWGERGRAPDATRPSERNDATIWREAIDRLEWPLRVKGIVRLPVPRIDTTT